jgi:hypothetical protein
MASACGEQSAPHLCPEGTWQLSAPLRSLLDREIVRLPNKGVSEDETRYPIDAAGMRAFLSTFFTRHLFQLQNSLLDYLASGDFSGRIAPFAVRPSINESCLSQSQVPVAVGLFRETKTARQQAQHAQRDALGFQKGKCLADQLCVSRLPVRIQNTGINAQPDGMTMFLAPLRSGQPFLKTGRTQLMRLDDGLRVGTPGHQNVRIGFEIQQPLYVGALSQQHQTAPWQMSEIRHQLLRQTTDVIRSEAVKHPTHIESGGTIGIGNDLPPYQNDIRLEFFRHVPR